MESRATLRVAGIAAWLVVAGPLVAAVGGGLDAASAAAWLGFGVAFAASSWRRLPAWASPAWLAVQSVCALALIHVGGARGFDAILLTVVAAQLPFCVPRRAAVAWLAAQIAAHALAIAGVTATDRIVLVLAWAAFQGFAFAAALLADREMRARAGLARVNAELLAAQELLAQQSRVAERLRIARDLHDAVGHHLTGLALQLEVASHVADGKAKEHVDQAQSIARLLLAEVRDAIASERAAVALDLRPTIERLVAETRGPRVELVVSGELELAEPAPAQALFRCVQEILTNVVRHSAARTARIELRRTPTGIEVHAHDDGHGADAVRPGHGLTGMRERLEQLGGTLELHTERGKGFAVRAFVPVTEVS